MASDGMTVSVRVEGAREVLAAFRALPKDASDRLRDASQDLARLLASRAAASGRREGRQAALVAATVRAQRDRVPVVVAGGSARLGRRQKPAWKLLFGSEFGAETLPQYKPHLGSGSYWFFVTIQREQTSIAAAWRRAADRIVDDFGGAAV